MRRLLDRYARKMVDQGLVAAPGPLMAGLDAELTWSREDPRQAELAPLFEELNILCLCLARPAEPYRTVVDHLAAQAPVIAPEDNETRLFLHELPVARRLAAGELVPLLKRRKAVIVPGEGIVTCGTVSPEQCFVVYSSVLFACFVKFFADLLAEAEHGDLPAESIAALKRATAALPADKDELPALMRGPFRNEAEVHRAVCEAGKPLVARGWVDSVMGNVSYRWGETLYISQTGSFLDELEGCVDPCPLDDSACTAITASTELPAHRRIVTETGHRAVLHGHPKFAVVMSLACGRHDCGHRGRCRTDCPQPRQVAGVPVVTGESGTGPRSLSRTVPEALKNGDGVIVHGHGVFTAGALDFNRPLARLAEIERECRRAYFRQLEERGVAR